MRCSVAGALEAIGDRWTILVLRDLSLGLHRYDALRASTGIPTTTLASRLRNLQGHGLVERVRYQNRPPRHEYVLTEKGRGFWKVITALREWGDRWDLAGCGAPTLELFDQGTGRALRLALVDSSTDLAASPARIRYRPGPGADDAVRALIDSINQGANAWPQQ
jgi:DNA-binding HxlR family transcriptional regulator